MSENCTHNCETCGESCPSREGGFPKEQLKEGCSVKKVIGIVSGKGGVGKSMVTSLLSVILTRTLPARRFPRRSAFTAEPRARKWESCR